MSRAHQLSAAGSAVPAHPLCPWCPEQRSGHRDLLADSVGALLTGGRRRRDHEALTVFSPSGLGVLDLAVADLVHHRAPVRSLGTDLPGPPGPGA
ncbi:hypothetical protein AB0K43_23465 [Kitasatospora sp. NPDC049258]|uniref:hypothetical protein n=1 Tax=Kitasatospora sp. NPDC049258 TaxID=3155394 RepID=UPI00342812A0